MEGNASPTKKKIGPSLGRDSGGLMSLLTKAQPKQGADLLDSFCFRVLFMPTLVFYTAPQSALYNEEIEFLFNRRRCSVRVSRGEYIADAPTSMAQ